MFDALTRCRCFTLQFYNGIYSSRVKSGSIGTMEKTALLKRAFELSTSQGHGYGEMGDTIDWVTGLFSVKHSWDREMLFYDVSTETFSCTYE